MALSAQAKLAKKYTSEIVDKIGLKCSVEAEDQDSSVEVSIKGDNLGALIGYHGQTLESLQLLLGLMINKEAKEGEWVRVVVDVGDYREEREEKLSEMVKRAVGYIESGSSSEEILPPMSPSERRSVHVILSEGFPDYQSESVGEDPGRRVKIFKK